MAKNKLKTNKSAAKRFRFNGQGLVKFKRAKMRHRMRRKEKDPKRTLRKPGYFTGMNLEMAKKLMPYA